MKTKICHTITAIILFTSVFGQKPMIELTFTAIDSTAYAQLDSIKIMNLSLGGDTTLIWPDTVFVLSYQVGLPKNINDTERFELIQNYPNPMSDRTIISIKVPKKDKVSLIVADMIGRPILSSESILDRGIHSFQLMAGNGSFYFFTANWRGLSSSIKILQSASSTNYRSSLEYIGSEGSSAQLKATEDIQDFLFNIGNELLYIGYSDTLQSGMIHNPEESHTITFQYSKNIPCPGTPTVFYEGQVYNTIQVFSQCWLKENLNVGTMIPGSQDMEDNNTIEKYCYGNNSSNCDNYGGLYIWDEMMQYTVQQGAQGICPPGWHVPKDEEWKILEGCVDSYYGIGDQVWDLYGMRGYDAGKNLKATTGWSGNGNGTDLFGFSGLPGGGYLYNTGAFYYIGQVNLYWSSTEGNATSAWNRYFIYDSQQVDRDFGNNKGFGFSIRCLRNN